MCSVSSRSYSSHVFCLVLFFFFFFKQKTAYEIGVRLVGSEMCIRDSLHLEQDERRDLLNDPIRTFGSYQGYVEQLHLLSFGFNFLKVIPTE